jgi:hypothetical protein
MHPPESIIVEDSVTGKRYRLSNRSLCAPPPPAAEAANPSQCSCSVFRLAEGLTIGVNSINC